jgi:hypothetical protein
MMEPGGAGSAGCVVAPPGTNIQRAIKFTVGNAIPNYLFAEYPADKKTEVTYIDKNGNTQTELLYKNEPYPW